MAESDVARPIRFGGPGAPSRQWAEEWPDAFAAHFREVLKEYRHRVAEHWAAEYKAEPGAFQLASPVEVVAIATLADIWIFTRTGDDDRIRVVEEWEHELFADWRFKEVPEGQAVAAIADAFLGDAQWTLLERQEVTGHASFTHIYPYPRFVQARERARYLADRDGSSLELQRALYEDIRRAVDQDFVDCEALQAAHARLELLRGSGNPHQRGRDFEEVVEALLLAHGCEVERGVRGDAEQVDIFMTDPQYALIECRWASDPLQPEVIYNLRGKLSKRPAFVLGIYVSMSGFTSGARQEAQGSRERGVILLDETEILQLAEGRISFRRMLKAKLRDLITRYGPGDR